MFQRTRDKRTKKEIPSSLLTTGAIINLHKNKVTEDRLKKREKKKKTWDCEEERKKKTSLAGIFT